MLSDCSLKLINLIIKQETLTQIQQEIATLYASIKSHKTTQNYKDLHMALLDNIAGLEDQITFEKNASLMGTHRTIIMELFTLGGNRIPHPSLLLKHQSPHHNHQRIMHTHKVSFSILMSGGIASTSEDLSDSLEEWRLETARGPQRGGMNRTSHVPPAHTATPRSKNGGKRVGQKHRSKSLPEEESSPCHQDNPIMNLSRHIYLNHKFQCCLRA